MIALKYCVKSMVQNIGPIFLLFLATHLSSLNAQAVFESFDTEETGGDGTYFLDAKPSGVTEGDLLLAVVCYESGNSQTVTPPSGWTSIAKTDHSSDFGMHTFYKVADVQDVNAATFEFELSEDKKWSLGVSRISGVDGVDPIHVYSENSGGGGNPVATSVNTTEDDCLVLAIYGNKKEATYQGNFNEEYEIENTDGGIASQMVETFLKAGSGSTGNTTAIPSEKDAWIAQQIAIKGTDVTLLNNFRSIKSGSFSDNTVWERERSNGTWLSPSDVAPGSDSNITVQDTHEVICNAVMSCVSSQVKIETGGSLKVMF